MSSKEKSNTSTRKSKASSSDMRSQKSNDTRRQRASIKISKMIEKSDLFLKTICSDSGMCIALGKKTEDINAYFKGFVNFEYALSPIKKIGKVSANGFIKEIAYEKAGYKSFAILKSAQNEYADNLVYEYAVGKNFINVVNKLYPCFVETYGLYFYDDYDDYDSWKIMKGIGPLHKGILKSLIKQDTIDYKKACLQSQYASVLIQHIKDAKTLRDYTYIYGSPDFVKHELLHVLFIIYQALNALRKKFTHYDLHNENVLLYEPELGKYIQYNYHKSISVLKTEKTTVFYSAYIPKIIDYGRSYVHSSIMNSKKIFDTICAEKACNPYCGENVGFQWFNTDNDLFIASSKKNESHDLRLLNMCINDVNRIKKNESVFNMDEPSVKNKNPSFLKIYEILQKIKYGVGIEDKTNKQFGSIENLGGKLTDGTNIVNVNLAYKALKRAIESPDVIAENKEYYEKTFSKLGDIHIYDDGRPMVYIRNV